MSTKRIKKLAAELPRTRTELESLVTATVLLQTTLEEQTAKRDAAMIEASKPFEPAIAKAGEQIEANLELIEMWSELHRSEFSESKSIKAGPARIGWRLGNWSTKLTAKVKWDAVVAFLQTVIRGADRSNASETTLNRALLAAQLLRTKVEANKEAMIEGRERPDLTALLAEAGVEIVQGESFYLEPEREGQAAATLTA